MMKKITLYLDMDGVLSNFEKAYRAMWNEFTFDRQRFREAVMQREIFRTLELMPNALSFIEGVKKIERLYGLNVEILTSTGTHNSEMKLLGIQQKTDWLKSHGITWKPNFVSSKPEKSKYAGPYNLLVDDHIGCINPFREKGGIGFLHVDAEYETTLEKLGWCLDELTTEFV